jgi:hypothetical protein
MPIPKALAASLHALDAAVKRCDAVEEGSGAHALAQAMRPFLATLREATARTITEAAKADGGRVVFEGTPEAAALTETPIERLAAVDRSKIEDADDRRTLLYAELLSRPVRTYRSALTGGR